MKKENKNNNVYIMSIEGADLYENMNRENYIIDENGKIVTEKKELHTSFVGMFPHSSELVKLKETGLKTFDSKRYNKVMTNDIINVKFRKGIKSGKDIAKSIKKKNKEDIRIEFFKSKDDWESISIDDLREKLYVDGFELEIEGKKVRYTVYKRSSAKSRTSQVLFIKESMRYEMIKWARLGMNLDDRDDCDFPSLLAYESLVSSSVDYFIKINPDNILIVDDIKSIFPIDCNVVEKDEEGKLVSNPVDNYMMENDIFDGEGLLQLEYFPEGKTMQLLRQHMAKCCAFACDIQKFLRDNCPDDIDFDTWKINNMFNEPMLASEIHMILTPASLKALKFSDIKGSKPKMWKHWKEKVKKENNQFGVVKYDKESKRGRDYEDNILQQTSYQMLNSMPISYSDMKDLSFFECEYVMELKNNDDTYIEYLKQNANNINCNNMLVDLYMKNKNIVNLDLFKNKRTKDIHNYVNHVKKGKIRLNGDYCTILGNGKELLYHAIRQLPVEKGILNFKEWESKMILKDNEIYTTLHDFNCEYVGFRNPHTAQSNVLIVKNKKVKFIEDYFVMSDNIIYVNSINFPICRILSGQDLDSDNLVLFSNCKLLELARKCYIKSDESNYRVCVNNVAKSPVPYAVNSSDHAKIDNILAKSQFNIGTVVNLGALFLSEYWHRIKNKNNKDLDKLLNCIDICTILSEISIDSAKRLYDIDISEQIKYLYDSGLLRKEKPDFFKYVSQNEKITTKHYDTAMDYLFDAMDNLPDAKWKNTITMNNSKLLKDVDTSKAKDRQVKGIIENVVKMSNSIKAIEATYKLMEKYSKIDKKEKYNSIDDVISDGMYQVKKYKVKIETVVKILLSDEFEECQRKLDLLNALYKGHKENFLQAFK